jgi:hypothetical protein
MITKCKLPLGSVTYAEKAMRTLSRAAIYSEIVKLEDNKARGCIYGLELSCSQLENAKTVLREAGIKIKAFPMQEDHRRS